MAHSHDHHHHAVVQKNLNNAFLAGIVLNVLYVLLQMGVGIRVHSLSLISDASHNFADVASLLLSLIGFKLTKVKPNKRFTYGYRKTSVLIALVNSMILLISIGVISVEAVKRFNHPTPLPGKIIAIIASIGIFVNGISALFFFRDRKHDLNIKSAFVHLMADALISLGVVVGGIIIYFTGQYWIDPALSIAIALMILVSTWKLLSDSMKLSLDAVPENVDMDEIRKKTLGIKGIVDVHHLHVWALSTSENAMTGHLVLHNSITVDAEQKIKHDIRHLLGDLNIHHITLETEREKDNCEGQEC